MPRASVRWRVVVAGAAIPALVALPVVYAAAAEGEPTITFTATGTPPFACGTRPNLSSLSVTSGTNIIVANLTDVSATIDVGTKTLRELAPGKGVLLTLKLGQHELRMVPDCVVVDETAVVVVNMVPGWLPPDPNQTGGPDDPVDDPVPVTLATPSITGTAGSAAGPESPGGGAVAPGAGGPAAAGATSTASAGAMRPPVGGSPRPVADGSGGLNGLDDSLDSEVANVQAIDFGDSRDPKGGRLLALIAAICVFGVTAAIIRAIVSQRTSSTVSM